MDSLLLIILVVLNLLQKRHKVPNGPHSLLAQASSGGGPLKREEVCNIAVASAFVSQTKHFPVNMVPYLPDEFEHGENNLNLNLK